MFFDVLRTSFARRRAPRACSAIRTCSPCSTSAYTSAALHQPENILITSDERIKLLDFGLAKVLADADSTNDTPTVEIVTDAGTVLGTPGYMSPEQVHGQPLDARTDIFSYGVVLLKMLTGVSPFRRESRMATRNLVS